jgi:hypothetical protein
MVHPEDEQGGVDGTRTRDQNTHDPPKIAPDRASEPERESPARKRFATVRNHSRPSTGPELTDAELEQAVVDAVRRSATSRKPSQLVWKHERARRTSKYP